MRTATVFQISQVDFGSIGHLSGELRDDGMSRKGAVAGCVLESFLGAFAVSGAFLGIAMGGWWSLLAVACGWMLFECFSKYIYYRQQYAFAKARA